jgi:hypothetical protein
MCSLKNVQQRIQPTIDVVFCFRMQLGKVGMFAERTFHAQEQRRHNNVCLMVQVVNLEIEQ